MEQQLDIHDNRQLNKMGLETFRLFSGNQFDQAIDFFLTTQGDEKIKLRSSAFYLHNRPKPDVNDQAGHKQWQMDEESLVDINMGELYLEDELYAMYEMKILYAFKRVEITMKALLSGSFKGVNIKSFYQSDSMMQFLRSKDIELKKLDGYAEVNQLRLLNNQIKHSEGISDDIMKIQEFKSANQIDYNVLKLFYDRVKPGVEFFIGGLRQQLVAHLYHFDDDKIKRLAEEIVLRMEKADAQKLTEEILKLY